VDLFIMATDVDGVALHFGQPEERFLESVDLEEAARHILDGHFSAGAMLPKVEAAMQFVGDGGKRAVITRIDRIVDAVEGKAGTEFVAEKA
jgi:carbamate kinase